MNTKNASTKTALKPAQGETIFCTECDSAKHVEFHRLGTGRSKHYEVCCKKCGAEWEVFG